MSGVDPDLIAFYERIDEVDLPVFIGGSIATSIWGEPRATLDIDLVVAADGSDAERLHAAFPADRYYSPPIEVLRHTLAAASPGGFNIIDMQTSLKADCYAKGPDPLQQYGFDTAIEIDLDDLGVIRVASPTYLIAMKLRYFAMSGQDKHIRDIRGMVMGSIERIDQTALKRWLPTEELRQMWRDCQDRPGEE